MEPFDIFPTTSICVPGESPIPIKRANVFSPVTFTATMVPCSPHGRSVRGEAPWEEINDCFSSLERPLRDDVLQPLSRLVGPPSRLPNNLSEEPLCGLMAIENLPSKLQSSRSKKET